MYYIVEISGSHIGIEYGTTPADARRNAMNNFGRNNVTNAKVRELSKTDVEWVAAMGGYVPDEVRQQFKIKLER